MSYNQQGQTATESFQAKKAEFDELLAELQQVSDNNFGVDADNVNWGNEGSMAGHLEALREAYNSIVG